MSLESQIADLVSATNTLITTYNGKKTAIDAALAAAIAGVPETSRTWFVDQVNGNDANAGNTLAAPFKTLNKAISSTPASGQCTINLLSDYTFTVNVPVLCAYLVIFGYNAVTSGVTPKLRPQYFLANDSTTQMASLIFYSQSSNVELRNVDLVLPSVAGQAPAPTITRVCSFIKTNAASNMPPVLGVMLQTVVVTKASDFYGALVGISASVLALGCYGVTFPSDFAGKYVSTVGAGVASNTLSQVTTNLTTL
ncbi:hypothetical protein HCU66_07550 [Pseudomonas frederiksbergensis]|uniref:hypothetical protein n=1 Tax=Pseudomonas frederiksbergensis TaxID=104087 RepID=UPI00197CFD54|nr:hypothetical protein [Pseudomonas frederiksbergensis]MBN3862083.1 hypothetical protein [Pseudomonas frederiksbergensis]